MSFFITPKTAGPNIEKLEGKVWDNFQMVNTLVNAPLGSLIGKNGQIYCIKEWTEEVRQRRQKEYCIVDNIAKALVIAGFLTGIAALVLLSFSALAATVLGVTALSCGGLLLLSGAIIAVPQEESFGEQALLRVQRLWREGEKNYGLALAKMAKQTQQPQESNWQLEIFKHFQSQPIKPEAAALVFAAFLLPHHETQAQSKIKLYTTFNNSEIRKREQSLNPPGGLPVNPPGGLPLEGVPHVGGEVSDGEEGDSEAEGSDNDNNEQVSYGQEGIPD